MLIWLATAQAACEVVPAGSSLQDAIDAASVGDCLLLPPGDWDASIAIDKALTIAALDPTDPPELQHTPNANPAVISTGQDLTLASVKLNGLGMQQVLQFTGNNLVLDHVELHDGTVGAFLAANEVTIVASLFTGTNSNASGGHLNSSSFSFQDYGSEFFQGDSLGDGGALSLGGANGGSAQLHNTSFVANEADGDGGALDIRDPVGVFSVALVETSFESNVAGGNGGGIHAEGVQLIAVGTVLAGNSAQSGGGLAAKDVSGALDVAAICVNSATSTGGGVAIDGSTSPLLSLNGPVFSGNSTGSAGGAVYLANTAGQPVTTSISRATFANNIAPSSSGIYVDVTVDLTVNDSVFEGHTEAIGGGGSVTVGGTETDGTVFFNNTSDYPVSTVVNNASFFDPVLGAGGLCQSSMLPPTATTSGHGEVAYVPCNEPTVYRDLDGDGFGEARVSYDGCGTPPGYVADATDCDDTDDAVSPTAVESCNGIDDDCDGQIDIGAGPLWYTDADGDGYGDVATAVQACSAPTGTVALAGDCDDGDSTINPGAAEVTCDAIDNDCDPGTLDAIDADSDGFDCLIDCNDGNASFFPGAPETQCVDPDFNCDPTDDDPDLDGDGFSVCDGDCEDGDNAINPGVPEVCDAIDNDCSGAADDGPDPDGDGFAACDCEPQIASAYPGAPEILCDGLDQDCDGLDALEDFDQDGADCDVDCNDGNADLFPGNAEVCDGADQDCDTEIDEGLPSSVYYVDTDGDGFGDPASEQSYCDAVVPDGAVTVAGDCDDDAFAINPAATEVPGNTIDEDCDGVAEGAELLDVDGDGVIAADDCDDTDPTRFPGAVEDLSEVDRDCDGYTDPQGAIATCACASGSAGGALWLALPVLFSLRRRSPSRP